MPRLLTRIVAAFLIPCLVTCPSHSIAASLVSSSAVSDRGPKTKEFTSQAMALPTTADPHGNPLIDVARKVEALELESSPAAPANPLAREDQIRHFGLQHGVDLPITLETAVFIREFAPLIRDSLRKMAGVYDRILNELDRPGSLSGQVLSEIQAVVRENDFPLMIASQLQAAGCTKDFGNELSDVTHLFGSALHSVHLIVGLLSRGQTVSDDPAELRGLTTNDLTALEKLFALLSAIEALGQLTAGKPSAPAAPAAAPLSNMPAAQVAPTIVSDLAALSQMGYRHEIDGRHIPAIRQFLPDIRRILIHLIASCSLLMDLLQDSRPFDGLREEINNLHEWISADDNNIWDIMKRTLFYDQLYNSQGTWPITHLILGLENALGLPLLKIEESLANQPDPFPVNEYREMLLRDRVMAHLMLKIFEACELTRPATRAGQEQYAVALNPVDPFVGLQPFEEVSKRIPNGPLRDPISLLPEEYRQAYAGKIAALRSEMGLLLNTDLSPAYDRFVQEGTGILIEDRSVQTLGEMLSNDLLLIDWPRKLAQVILQVASVLNISSKLMPEEVAQWEATFETWLRQAVFIEDIYRRWRLRSQQDNPAQNPEDRAA